MRFFLVSPITKYIPSTQKRHELATNLINRKGTNIRSSWPTELRIELYLSYSNVKNNKICESIKSEMIPQRGYHIMLLKSIHELQVQEFCMPQFPPCKVNISNKLTWIVS